MRNYVLSFAAVTLICIVLIFLLLKHRPEPGWGDSQSLYSLPPAEIERLTHEAARGSCESSIRLAKYYLYGALDLDVATKWLRVAAKCSDIAPKEYLVQILMRNRGDPAAAEEVRQLIGEIRKTDQTKARELEDQLNKIPGPQR
jgi:hypothetical protein